MALENRRHLLPHQCDRKTSQHLSGGLTLLHFRFCYLSAVGSVSNKGMEKKGEMVVTQKVPARKARVTARKGAAHW